MATRGAAETRGDTKRRFYEILEVAPNATTDEIRRAFRRLARRHHPDQNPGDARAEERFKEIVRAHDVLVDPRQRSLYDEFGEAGLRRGFDPARARVRREATSGGDGASAGHESAPTGRRRGPIEGFLSGLFSRASAPERGSDVEVQVTVGFLEALRGAERTLAIRRPDRCRPCHGRGEGDDGGVCAVCHGSGSVEVTARLKTKVPPGVQTGSRIRLGGQGGAGRNGGPAGDLWMAIHVTEDPRFGRDGDDVTLDVPVTVADAVRGTRIEVPTPEGSVHLRIPAGTQGGARLRLRGKGAPRLDGGRRGDLIARIVIHVPESGEGLEQIAESLEPLYSESFRRRFVE
jgi:molecular chaperone DnaJ